MTTSELITRTSLTGDIAVFDSSERHRFLLTRELGGPTTLMTIGLNPSTATHEKPDPTITREIGFCRALGFGRLVKTNILPWRSTDPIGLLEPAALDILAMAENIDTILREARVADAVLCCWGGPYGPKRLGQLVAGQAALVTAHLREAKVELHVLALTKLGIPRHPLYLRGDSKLHKWVPSEAAA